MILTSPKFRLPCGTIIDTSDRWRQTTLHTLLLREGPSHILSWRMGLGSLEEIILIGVGAGARSPLDDRPRDRRKLAIAVYGGEERMRMPLNIVWKDEPVRLAQPLHFGGNERFVVELTSPDAYPVLPDADLNSLELVWTVLRRHNG